MFFKILFGLFNFRCKFLGVLNFFSRLLDASPTFEKHMRKFYKLSRPGKDKKPRNILVKTIFKGQLDCYKTEKFCSLYSGGKNNISS